MTDDDFSDLGFPAQQTRVYHDPRPLLPRPIRMATRKNALDRHARYRERKRMRKLLGEP